MGLFDIFKKKGGDEAEASNPFLTYLEGAGLGIQNLHVLDINGAVTVKGVAPDGETVAKVKELLTAKGIVSITNHVSILDYSDKNMRYRVESGSGNLNCRKRPNITAEIAGKFPKKSTVTLVQKHNEKWYRVKNKNLEGYCHTDYLKEV